MKIAIIGSHGYPFVYGGFETFVKELSERLIKLDDTEITVYCRKNYFKSFPKTVNGINLVYIYTIKRKKLAQLVHSFLSTLHVSFGNYDIIYVLNSGNGLFGLIPKIFGKKTIINVDGIEWERPKWKGLGAKFFLLTSFVATKLFDVVVTDSVEMQKIYKRKFNYDSVFIPYGEDLRFSKNPDLLEKWELTSKRYYLVVGRLIPDNNIEFIISEFTKSNSKLELVIVGDDILKSDFSRRIMSNKHKKLKFLRYISDHDELNELFCNCFAYIHGHEFGGTNPTLLQALASNLIIFAIDTVFSREVLENEKYGFLFKKEEYSLSNLLEYKEANNMALNKDKIMTVNRINEFYRWDKIVKEYSLLFKKLSEKEK